MLDFSKGSSRQRITPNHSKGKITYKNGIFTAKVGKHDYAIHPDSLVLQEYSTLYSLPSNDKYCDWTSKSVNLTLDTRSKSQVDIILSSWSMIRPGTYYGHIVDNQFKLK